jgi:histidinol-phosphate aminotransferase
VLARHEVIEEQARNIRAGRERLAGRLRMLPGVIPHPSDANFILARVPDSARVFEGLRRRGVLVKNFPGHPVLDPCLRMTVGTPEENEKLVSALTEALAGH